MLFKKKCLGIDIGATSVKLVELSSWGGRKQLENYAEFSFLPDRGVKTFEEESLLLISEKAAEILQAIFASAKIKERKAAISIPDFSTFFTSFNLPPMDKTEIPHAIDFEARHYIPLPLDEVNFDWQILEKKETYPGLALKVLLVAVPKKILMHYQKLTELAKINLKGLEAEVFGLIRSSLPAGDEGKTTFCLVDLGWQSTTVSIVENGALRLSNSFDISSRGMTKAISLALGVSFAEAEELKKENGLDPQKKEVADVLSRQIDALAFEIGKVCQTFYQLEGEKVEKIILAGGSATLFGLKEYLEAKTKKNVSLADPFSKTSFPAALSSRLKEIGPSFAVAVGVGLMGLES